MRTFSARLVPMLAVPAMVLLFSLILMFPAGNYTRGEEQKTDVFAEKFSTPLRAWGFVGDTLCMGTLRGAPFFLYNRTTKAVKQIGDADSFEVCSTEHYYVMRSVSEKTELTRVDVFDADGIVVASSGYYSYDNIAPEDVPKHPDMLGVFEFKRSIIYGLRKDICIIPLGKERKVEHIVSPAWETAVCNDKILHLKEGKLRVIYDDSGTQMGEYSCEFKDACARITSENADFFLTWIGEGDRGFRLTPIMASGQVRSARSFSDGMPASQLFLGGVLWQPYFVNTGRGAAIEIVSFDPKEGKWRDCQEFAPHSYGFLGVNDSAIIYQTGKTVFSYTVATKEKVELLSLTDEGGLTGFVGNRHLPSEFLSMEVFGDAGTVYTYYGRGASGLSKVEEAAKAIPKGK